ncbi:1308_t:CDS:2 [Paraglomus brasilianum]|uniref:1308_t:CDS:1 n=1 Tax=Paraglomus brasilianum TaxID=144538 RepID=A0A9N8ZRV6_9GLOM|nr:1308_t:CDS:2 [Paraglomus brasilianum]
MKFHSILVFLVASLAAGTYAAPAKTPCEIVLKGKFTHTTGSGQSGCFGTDPTDPISMASAPSNVVYKFYSGENCKGLIFTGSGVNSFTPPLQTKSTRLICS